MAKKILIVEDDEDVLASLEKNLVAAGFQVITSKWGREAVQKVKALSPDLILVDLMLPDIDGAEVVKLIENDPSTRKVPIIFLSGIVTEESADKKPVVKVSGTQYPALAKPFTVRQLLDEIKNYLH
jgi:DNA-binding response OmpR family regulator